MDIIGGQHLRQMWDDLADVYGHKTALICESSGGVVNRYSYLELNQEINRTANLFYTLGIRKGVALPADDGVSSFTQLKNQQPATLCYAPPLSTDDTAEILFTSGTTSRPKGVVITHYNLRFAGYYSAWQCALRDDDVYLTVMPAFHIDCQCTAAMAAFSAGATFVLVEKYSARAFWGQVQKYRASVKSVLKAYQGKPSSKSIFSTRKPLRKCWKPTAGCIPAIPDTATKRAFFISSIAAAI